MFSRYTRLSHRAARPWQTPGFPMDCEKSIHHCRAVMTWRSAARASIGRVGPRHTLLSLCRRQYFGHTDHRVTGDQRGELLLRQMLGAWWPLRNNEIANLG